MNARRVTAIAMVLVVAAGALAWWWLPRDVAFVPIGGSTDAIARADAQGESILPEALAAARAEAEQRGARALVVHRRGHRVFEWWADPSDAGRLVDGGELAAAVLALTLTEPGQDESSDAQQVAALVRDRLWLPLRAADARLLLRTDLAPRSCCIEARMDDWMRVGDLLLAQGTYLGERFVSADAMRQLLAARTPAPWEGDEPLVARDGLWFDLLPGARLWLAPRRNLTVLVWGAESGARDTLIPNVILRGLSDASPALGGEIDDIVPGH